jgi:hypothetical protein
VERLAQLVWLLQQDFVHEIELFEGGEDMIDKEVENVT